MDHKKKSALIVEGGGMRGIFAAGILHAFGNKGFDPFDLYIGVSAGACHLASHLAGQNSRNFDITLRYSLSRQFINPWRFLKGGHLMDLDWMWEQTIKNYRLDLKQIKEKLQTQKKDYLIVATSMETGGPLYLHPDINTLEHYLKVSSSLPILYRKEMDVKGEKATDGGISDSIPVREALRRGATDITVIRSRSAGYVKKESPIVLAVFSWYFRKYPRLIEAFRQRADRYNAAVAFINNPPSGVCIAQLAPPAALEIGRTTKNEATLRKAYKAGIDYGNRFIEHSVPFGHNK
ncbi:MAG TPA: patatin family protein [Smithellaceae bacterium]|jgi:predicted patatin/cPLA2 family phospholipase|nr:patatin family protein [Smithellaceae bacterium]HOG81616.1 patatin family protein [Smithellaceae bacterium]HOQ41704.1 patatin family protein [Smithellaceae bacterium]HPL66203.1 patatin family protein [Smithellaceae bacterium]HQP23896.1 patatin family protein [Smithellaceae bacterium]